MTGYGGKAVRHRKIEFLCVVPLYLAARSGGEILVPVLEDGVLLVIVAVHEIVALRIVPELLLDAKPGPVVVLPLVAFL